MKHLGDVNVLSAKVAVIITTPAEVGDEDLMSDAVHATFEAESNTIRLNEDSCTRVDMVRGHIMHEMVHAWFNHSGALYFLRTQMQDYTPQKMGLIEETLVRMLTPAINSSLDDLSKMFRMRGSK